MQPILAHPSWGQIDKACAVLVKRVCEAEDAPNAIVALARGGLVPGVIMSHILETKVFPVSYSSKQGNGEYREYDNVLPMISGDKLLIVDDIVDSGHTMKEVVEIYRSRGHEVITASLYYKMGSVFRPTHVWQEIPTSAPWIIFPWEI